MKYYKWLVLNFGCDGLPLIPSGSPLWGRPEKLLYNLTPLYALQPCRIPCDISIMVVCLSCDLWLHYFRPKAQTERASHYGPMSNSRFNCTIVKLLKWKPPLSEQNEFLKYLWQRKNSLCMLKSRLDELLNMLFSVTSLSLLVCMTDVCAYYSWNAQFKKMLNSYFWHQW
jgi:hypothetical protein